MDVHDCQDCDHPILTNYVIDEAGGRWHLRCLDSVELDDLHPTEINR